MKFKFFGEKVKQALKVSASGQKDWQPSSNDRNRAMVDEARKFAFQIKALHKDLVACEKAISGNLATVKEVLSTNLPKAYKDQGLGLGISPVDSTDRLVGEHVAIESLTSASNEMKERLMDEVLAPLEQWLSVYRTIKSRNKRCEEIRLDLDVKRRAFADVEAQAAKMEGKGKAEEGNQKAAREAEKMEFKKQTESDKTVRATQRYAEIEAEVYNALLTLIRDTSVLREYAAASILVMQKCFETSYMAFDLDTPASMPFMPPLALAPPAPVLALEWNGHNGSSGGGGLPTQGSLSAGGAPALLKSQTLQNNSAQASSMRASAGGGVQSLRTHSGGSVNPMRQSMPEPFNQPQSMSRPTSAYVNPFETPMSTPPPQPQPQPKSRQPPQAGGMPPKPMQQVQQPSGKMYGPPKPAPNNMQPAARAASPVPNKHQFRMPSNADLPPPPAWYNEAKLNSRPPTAYDKDSDSDDDTNPFR